MIGVFIRQGHKAKQRPRSRKLERATLLPGLLPRYIWLCSHTTVVSKYTLSKYWSGLLWLAESVFPPVCLLTVRLVWLSLPYRRYHPPGPPNYTLLSSSHHPAGLPSRAPAGTLFPSVVSPFVVWRASPLSYYVPEPERYDTAIVHVWPPEDVWRTPSPSALCCITDLWRRSVYAELPWFFCTPSLP